MDNKKKEQEFRYKRKGYDQSLKEATQFIEGLKLNHKALTNHQIKYLDVMHELLMKHKDFNAEPVTIIQPNLSNEKLIEYYEIDSDESGLILKSKPTLN